MAAETIALDHVAVGVPRIADTVPFLVGELGGRAAGGGIERAFAFRQWRYGGGKLEVLEPAGPPGGFLHRFLDRRGPGVHHVTFLVPDLDRACDRAAALGFEVVERDQSHPEWQEAFLHPKSSMSIVVQLAARSGAERAPEPPPRPEPGDPEPGPPGIVLVGLRLAARDLERARELWVGLLGGAHRHLEDELEVRWPGSPLRLLVRPVERGRDEGPLALELACLRPALLPQGRHPVIGAVFDPVDITELPPPEPDSGLDPERPEWGESRGGGDDTYFLDGAELERPEDDPP